MKTIKLVIIMFILFISCSFCIFAATTEYGVRPNYATNSHVDLSFKYYGYIQIKPSVNQHGYHAYRGWIRYRIKDNSGAVISDSGRQYTPAGRDQEDDRILSKNYTFTDTISFLAQPTIFNYNFQWIAHSNTTYTW